MKQALLTISIFISTSAYSQSLIKEVISQNDYELVVSAMDSLDNVNINVSDYYGSPLQLALSIQDIDIRIIEFLLEKGADPQLNLKSPDMCFVCAFTPIQLAIKNKNYAALQLLINRNINLDSIVVDYAPIHYAVYQQDTTAMKMLMSHNVSMNTKDQNDYGTPIEIAVRWSYDVSLAFLLKNGVKVRNTAEELYLRNMDCCGDGFGELISEDMRLKTITVLYENGIKPTEEILTKAEKYKSFKPAYYDYFRSKGLIVN